MTQYQSECDQNATQFQTGQYLTGDSGNVVGGQRAGGDRNLTIQPNLELISRAHPMKSAITILN